MSDTSQASSSQAGQNEKCTPSHGSRRRQVHNAVERRRKDKINGWISKIAELLPNKELHKQSKISILEQTVDHIKLLTCERDKLLTETVTEVQAEEIQKLKRDLKVAKEKNTVYERLLKQANINLHAIPEKSPKYTEMYIKRNGVLNLTNAKLKELINSECSDQDENGMIISVPEISSTESNCSNSSEKVKTSEPEMHQQHCSGSTVTSVAPQTVSQNVELAASNVNTSTLCIAKSTVPTCIVSSNSVVNSASPSTVPTTTPLHTQGNAASIANSDAIKSTPLESCGVTSVLSSFPVMSTTHSSPANNMCNKNVPTVLIPTGGSILQQFPMQEKLYNAISFLYPSTVPVLVPQQVLNVSSLPRSASFPFGCPTMLSQPDPQIEKSPLGSAMLSVNPNTFVPMTSVIPVNTRLVVPQSSLVENTFAQSAISSVVNQQLQCNQLLVPLVQNIQLSTNMQVVEKNVSVSRNDCYVEKNAPLPIPNEKQTVKSTTTASSSSGVANANLSANNSEELTKPDKIQEKKAKEISKFPNNVPPSLQVLSANKIISLANQSQKVRANLMLPLYQKASSVTLQPNNNESNQTSSNNICVQIDTPGVTSSVRLSIEEPKDMNEKQQAGKPMNETSKASDVSSSKTDFSLVVLMGESSNVNNDTIQGNKECNSVVTTITPPQSMDISSETASVDNSPNASHSPQSEVSSTSLIKSKNDLSEATSVMESSDTKLSSSHIGGEDGSNSSGSKIIKNVNLMPKKTTEIKAADTCLSNSKNNNQSITHMINKNSEITKSIPEKNVSEGNLLQTGNISSAPESSHNLNNILCENMSLISNENSVSHSNIPPLFPNNQIMNVSSVFMCHSTSGNSETNISQVNEATIQPMNQFELPIPTSGSSVLNKDGTLINSFSIENNNNSSEIITALVENKEKSQNIYTLSENEIESSKCISENMKKKGKAMVKACKANLNVAKSNSMTSENISENYSNFIVNKTQLLATANDLASKTNSNSMRQVSNNFIFTSDILARATESIFGSDILENSQLSKRDSNYYDEDHMNLGIAVSSPSKVNESNEKLQGYHCPKDSMDTHDLNSPQKVDTNMSLVPMLSSGADNNQPSVKMTQEISQRQNKICKSKKSKSSNEIEPVTKKMKITTTTSDKTTTIHSDANDGGVHFGPQQLMENNCKMPSSVDSIFSLTPALGDILKDVPHNNVNLESRNAFENQALFPPEKNLLSFSYSSSTNEEYMNLPRMYFPLVPDVSTTPVVQVTNVSFAHNASLCSTQSDALKTVESVLTTESQGKIAGKKKINLPLPHESHSPDNTKPTDCASKLSNSVSSFNIDASKVPNSSLSFTGPSNEIQIPNSSTACTQHSPVTRSDSNLSSRNSFVTTSSQSINLYPTLSSCTLNMPQNFVSTSLVPHNNYSCSNSTTFNTAPFPVQSSVTGNNSNTFSSESSVTKADSLSHSLCSLLKETSNILVENRLGTTTTIPSTQPVNSVSSSTALQSKYSALSLISDQTTFTEHSHSDYSQPAISCASVSSDVQYTAPTSLCNRNQRASLSYSAESLLQTHCASSDKHKSKNNNGSRYTPRANEKKGERSNVTNIHNVSSDTNIFMPVSTCNISIQNAPLVPLPPVTSFHNFASNYPVCESAPVTTLFNAVTRSHDIPLSLSNENFLNHVNLSVESQMLNSAATVPKPHTNLALPFENHGTLYNNCNFLQHVKPTIETCRTSESNACFQPSSFNNNYSQQSQKPNCCHFGHRTVTSSHELTPEINPLSVAATGTSFHAEKSNHANRSSLQASFPQSNSNFIGNFFYNPTTNTHDMNMSVKPSTTSRVPQEMFVPEGSRQSVHEHNMNNVFTNRKNNASNRTKPKKAKNVSSNETSMLTNCVTNFNTTQDATCNKTNNISYVPNGYFKNNTQSIIPPPNQLQCPQNKITDSVSNAVIQTNPPFNAVLHQQGDNFLNLNFQPPNFTVSPLPRPPTQPLSCSCITAPIISHTFSSTAHPVPNFNLSNILPDMSCTGNQISLSPVKYPSINTSLQSTPNQCQSESNMTNSVHIVSHQSCVPSLYPPHPSMVRGTLNPILSHNPQSLNENQLPLVGSTNSSITQQNATFTATQNPPFRNVIHSLSFPHNDR